MSDECRDILIDGVFSKFEYRSNSLTEESLKEWFFSEEFEKYYRRAETSVGFSIPLPVLDRLFTFGGDDQSEGAWEARANEEYRAAWDFRNITWTSVLLREEAGDVIAAWSKCMQDRAEDWEAFNRVRVAVTSTLEAVSLEVRYKAITGAPVPRITGVRATPSLDATAANDQLDGSEMSDVESFILSWQPNAYEAVIVVETDIGDSEPTQVVRPVAGEVEVEYYVPDRQEWTFDRNEERSATTRDMNHKRARDGHPRSPDGKWMADVVHVSVNVDHNEIIRDATWRHAAGPPTHQGAELKYANKDRTVTGHLKAWTYPVTYRLTAPVFRAVVEPERYTKTFRHDGREFMIDLPTDTLSATGRLAIESKLVVFEVGKNDDDGIVELMLKEPAGRDTRYSYRIRRTR